MNRRLFSLLIVLLLMAVAVGTVAAQTSAATWFVTYYGNGNLEGAPVATDSEGNIDHNWGSGAPMPGMAADGWSARWTSYVTFQPGTYRFTTINDDGVRIFLGTKHILIDWNKHPQRTNTAVVSLSGGTYPMAVDYFEDVGAARLKVQWERIGPPSGSDLSIISSGPATPPAPPASQATWYAQYWNNMDLQGAADVTRGEAAINFDWGFGSPSSVIDGDTWSARWSSSVYLAPGTYRFTAVHDDGIRVFVGDQHIINNWSTGVARTSTGTITVQGGSYPVVVDFFEYTGVAVAKVWWERMDGQAPAPSTSPYGVTATTTVALRLRSGPSTDYTILTVLPRGTAVGVIGRTANNNWIQVQHAGRIGWMATSYTTLNGNLANVPVTG